MQNKEGKEIEDLENKINEYETIPRTNSPKNEKVLFDGEMSSGTITFENDKIDDYEYFEFIYGIEDKSRLFSQIVSKRYLKLPFNNGDERYLSGTSGETARCNVTILNVNENSIRFQVNTSGGNWQYSTGYIYQIIGIN